ncbi:MAG: glycosyltransferase family 4 protein [Clostridiales bacterium]|nr:glycosyltransferase family 4 protein [Clostridiales bacterium]
MKRALIITTVSGFVPQFEMNNVRILQDLGYEVHYAANYHMPVYTDNNERLEGTGIIQHQIDFVRSPYNIGKNIKALKQLVSLMRSIKFHLVHCHTPMGGVLGRIAAHKTNTKPVIYTAHGFHFYKGAPVWNWLFFYPVERCLAHWTDCLITINKEDYERAKRLKVKSSVNYVPGVGINRIDKLSVEEIKNKRIELGIPLEGTLLISVGELNKNKNQRVILKILKESNMKNLFCIICGEGPEKMQLNTYIKRYNLESQVKLLGFRQDIDELLMCSNIFVCSSKREGLSVAVMEALSYGIPVIATSVRGNRELIKEGINGYLVSKNSVKKYLVCLKKIKNLDICMDRDIYLDSKYYLKSIEKQMKEIYISMRSL